MGLLLGLCAFSTLTNPAELLLLMQGAERVSVVVGWIGGWL
jgi:hypothetical protein